MRTASPKHAVVSAAVGARCLRACAAPQFSSIVVQFQHQFGKHRGRPDVERWHHVVFPVSSPPRICYNCVSFSGFRLNFKLGLPPPTRRVQIPARASVSARVEGLLLSFVLFFFFLFLSSHIHYPSHSHLFLPRLRQDHSAEPHPQFPGPWYEVCGH